MSCFSYGSSTGKEKCTKILNVTRERAKRWYLNYFTSFGRKIKCPVSEHKSKVVKSLSSVFFFFKVKLSLISRGNADAKVVNGRHNTGKLYNVFLYFKIRQKCLISGHVSPELRSLLIFSIHTPVMFLLVL